MPRHPGKEDAPSAARRILQVSLNLRPTTRAVPIDRTGPTMCRGDVHRHCQCGAQVDADDVVVTTSGRYYICSNCWSVGRRRWFRPDTKAERIRALEVVEGLLEAGCE